MKSSKNNIPIFIINLEKDKIKKEHMRILCYRYNLEPTFIKAIDGNSLSNEEIKTVYTPAESIRHIGRELSKGEIGCALSHRKIYKKMVKENIPIALILEDDINFNEDLIIILKKVKQLSFNWDIILLGHHSMKSRNLNVLTSLWFSKNIYKNYKIKQICEVSAGSYGYLINLPAAVKLLKYTCKIYQPIDHFIGNPYQFKVYGIFPAIINICKELEGLSSIEKERKKLQLKYFSKKEHPKTAKRYILEKLGIYNLAKNFFDKLINFWKRIKPVTILKSDKGN